MGEFGELLLPGNGGLLLPDEPAIATVTEADVVGLIEVVMKRGAKDSRVREVALMAGESSAWQLIRHVLPYGLTLCTAIWLNPMAHPLADDSNEKEDA